MVAAPDPTTNTILYAGTATGPNTAVSLLNDLSVEEQSDLTEVTDFGDTWISRLQALQSAKFSGGGFFDYYNDATGQAHILDNALSGTALWFKLKYGASADDYYVNTRVMVSDFTMSTAPKGMVEFKFSAESTGTITHGAD